MDVGVSPSLIGLYRRHLAALVPSGAHVDAIAGCIASSGRARAVARKGSAGHRPRLN